VEEGERRGERREERGERREERGTVSMHQHWRRSPCVTFHHKPRVHAAPAPSCGRVCARACSRTHALGVCTRGYARDARVERKQLVRRNKVDRIGRRPCCHRDPPRRRRRRASARDAPSRQRHAAPAHTQRIVLPTHCLAEALLHGRQRRARARSLAPA